MSEYYFNEKKGRYEPVSEAPFGIAPKPKRDRSVFTAENYMEENKKSYSVRADLDREPYTRPAPTRPASPVKGFEDGKMRISEALKKAGIESNSTGTQSNSAQRSYTGAGQKQASKKSKASIAVAIGLAWAVVAIIRACSE